MPLANKKRPVGAGLVDRLFLFYRVGRNGRPSFPGQLRSQMKELRGICAQRS